MNKTFNYNDYYDAEAGYLPEDLFIWVPPKPRRLKDISFPLDQVILDKERDHLVFFVPKEWAKNNIKSGWRTRLKDIGWTLKRETSGLLNEFVRLDKAPPESFLDFAKKWGPLWRQVSCFKGEIPEGFHNGPWIESLEDWRSNVIELKTILELVSYTSNDEAAPQDLRDKLCLTGYKDIDKQREWIVNHINVKMKNFNITLFINWGDSGLELKIGLTLGFISAAWFQLLQAITNTTICLCDGCSKVYVRENRRPARGKRNYCGFCGPSASKRDYARIKRQK